MQGTMERILKIQMLQEQRIIELGRQLESYREKQARFSLFSRLPPELRYHIWNLAMPLQILRPFRHRQPFTPKWKSLTPPTISRVCREARHVAYRQGTLHRHGYLTPVSWTWFSGKSDIIDLSAYRFAEDSFIPLNTSLLQAARAIVLDLHVVNDLSIPALNSPSSHLGNVDTIYLSVETPFQVERRLFNPHAVARLFRDQSFALIDIEDDQELEHVEQILQDSGHDENNVMGGWHMDTFTRLQEQIRPLAEKMKTLRDAKQLLLEGWMSHHYRTLPLAEGFLGENREMNEEGARKRYPQSLTVKLVQTLELMPVFTRMPEDIRG